MFCKGALSILNKVRYTPPPTSSPILTRHEVTQVGYALVRTVTSQLCHDQDHQALPVEFRIPRSHAFCVLSLRL